MSHPDNAILHQSSSSLPRSLSTLETLSFGLTAHNSWIVIVPTIHAALGPQAIFIWIPAVLFGMLLNSQVKRLGSHFIGVLALNSLATTR